MACARALACGRIQLGDEANVDAIDFRPAANGNSGAAADAASLCDIAILEARERLGGRAHTHLLQLDDSRIKHVDLGAAFVHGAFSDSSNVMAHLAKQSNTPLVRAGAGYGRGWVESNAWFDAETGAPIDAAVVARVRRIADAVHDDIAASSYWLAYQAGGLYDAAALSVADQLEHSLRHVERALRCTVAPGLERRLFDSMLVSAIGYVGALDDVSLVAFGFERADSGRVSCSARAAHLANALTWIDRVDGVSTHDADNELSQSDEADAAATAAEADTATVAATAAATADGGDDTAAASPDGLLIKSGYGELVARALAVPSRVKVCLSARVMQLSYDAKAKRVLITVREEGESKQLSCDYCVCTVPLGVLQSGEPQFVTPLSEAKRLSISRLGVGIENKLIMCFERNFWGDAGGYFACTDPRFRFLNGDSFGEHKENVLVAMLAPPFSHQYGSKDDCLATVLGVLRRVFHDAPDPVAWVVTAWDTDTFSRGSYSFLRCGSSQEDIAELQRLEYDGHLLFAGEATSLLNQQCVHGAANTGIRAANKIRAYFGLQPCRMPFPLQDAERDRCATCDLPWDTEQPLIQCEVCDRWYHQECQNLSVADKPHKWRCMKCTTKKTRGRQAKRVEPPSATTTIGVEPVIAAAAAAAAAAATVTQSPTSMVVAVPYSLTVVALPDMAKLLELTDGERAANAERSEAFFADESLGQQVGDAVQRSVPSANHYFEVGALMSSNPEASIMAGDVFLRHTALAIDAMVPTRKRPGAPQAPGEAALAVAATAAGNAKRSRAPAKRSRKQAPAAATAAATAATAAAAVDAEPPQQRGATNGGGGGDDGEAAIVDIVSATPVRRVAVRAVDESPMRITETSIVDFLTVEVHHWGAIGGSVAVRDGAPIFEGFEVRIKVDDTHFFVKTTRNGNGTMLGFRISAGEEVWPWCEHLADAWTAAAGAGVPNNIVPIECTLGYDVPLVRSILCRLHGPLAASAGVDIGREFSRFAKRSGARTLCAMCKLEIKREQMMGACSKCHRAFHYLCFQKFSADQPVCTPCDELDGVPCIKCGHTDNPTQFLMCEHLLDPKAQHYCPVGMHMLCAEPPLRKLPDTWFCPAHTPTPRA